MKATIEHAGPNQNTVFEDVSHVTVKTREGRIEIWRPTEQGDAQVQEVLEMSGGLDPVTIEPESD